MASLERFSPVARGWFEPAFAAPTGAQEHGWEAISKGDRTPILGPTRQRSLAALRREVEPVDASALGRFFPAWQGVGSEARGLDRLVAVVRQLQGVRPPTAQGRWSPVEADLPVGGVTATAHGLSLPWPERPRPEGLVRYGA